MPVAIIAEKPSVARDIARVVGAAKKGEGYLYGGDYVVTWAVGHLVRLAEPHEIRPEWRAWRRELLPMLPREWPLVVIDQTRDQFEVVRKIVTSPKIQSLICATDAGREGELIFRYLYEAAGSTKPVLRLWLSSLTPDAIRAGLASMKDGSQYDSLADAARGRSRADWLVGMNLSRAYSLSLGENFSVGRVQTPTLAMVVAREIEIRAFVPEDYFEVVATFSAAGGEYQGTWFREGPEPLEQRMRLPADGAAAEAIVGRAKTGAARVESVEAETRRMPPPLLYDLTELQRHANRLYGYSAQKTLDLAQALYEHHKLLSYPRTDSRHLSAEVAKTLPRVVAAVREPYAELLAPGTGERPLGKRFVDDTKVTDHHAIIPTAVRAGALNPDEKRIYDLVCRRLLSAWHADHVWSATTVVTAIANDDVVDRYRSTGTAVEQAGWKVLDIAPPAKKDEPRQETLPAGLAGGLPAEVRDAKAVRKKTRPPKRFTEATLLTAMETAGRTLDDKELSDAMKDCGLGTPATRAAIIEVLLKREYIERQGKSLAATNKGIRLIEVVHPEVKSPAMTGQWEAFLARIHRGEAALPPFIEGIENYVREVVGKTSVLPAGRTGASACPGQAEAPAPLSAQTDLEKLLRERFGFEAFRPNQEAVCRAVSRGDDVLLVMPTGSGKSLCYQLPGLARGGTTLVISPLIALMEDQVSALRAKGIAAERIHSGRDRAASRQACFDYLNGKLQFLFVAPERLRIAGFPEMLAKRKPSLIAIDEAHCISQWGHDFRPDYRRIGAHLPALRPAPVIALTATATPRVQQDIIEQLGLCRPARFIRGFRRDNIAIEVVEVAESRRLETVLRLLEDPARRPAIVYTPTRKLAESFAAEIADVCTAAPYHAGMTAKRRDEVQAAFLAGRTEVIVATIAFGMGVDKPNVRTVIHVAIPGSIEGYYQEIGRAGRDGQPSRAILMQSYSDRRTHDYFFERDYPETSVLSRLFALLTAEPQTLDALRERSAMDEETFDTALDKLWTHGGVQIEEETAARGADTWPPSYEAQREHKLAQLNEMLRYSECNQCRMAALVRHFGDEAGARERCGICDFCAPGDSIVQRYRPAAPEEQRIAREILGRLRAARSVSTGRLHQQLGGVENVDRRVFERILAGLARAGWIEIARTSFAKDGKDVKYTAVALTDSGRTLEPEAPLEFEITEVIESHTRVRRRKKAPAAPKKRAEGGSGVYEALRAWRLAEARRQGVPPFHVATDRMLRGLAADLPTTEDALVNCYGMGPRRVEKYGAAILKIISGLKPGATQS